MEGELNDRTSYYKSGVIMTHVTVWSWKEKDEKEEHSANKAEMFAVYQNNLFQLEQIIAFPFYLQSV